MTNKHDTTAGHEAAASSASSDATWHPFNVWRTQVKLSTQTESAALLASDASASRDWDPYSVWKNQVKKG